MLRSGVERQLEIVGEALSQLSKVAPQIAARLDGVGKAIGLRNSLIHGYTVIDHSTIWRTVVEDLPPLREAVRALLDELGKDQIALATRIHDVCKQERVRDAHPTALTPHPNPLPQG